MIYKIYMSIFFLECFCCLSKFTNEWINKHGLMQRDRKTWKCFTCYPHRQTRIPFHFPFPLRSHFPHSIWARCWYLFAASVWCRCKFHKFAAKYVFCIWLKTNIFAFYVSSLLASLRNFNCLYVRWMKTILRIFLHFIKCTIVYSEINKILSTKTHTLPTH